MHKPIVITYGEETPMSEIRQQILNSEVVSKVEFFCLNGSRIPLCETAGDLNDFPIVCQVDGDRRFELNFTQ